MWGLGVFQAVMILVLSLRMRQIDDLSGCGGRPSEELRSRICKAQTRIRWLYGSTCVLFVIVSTLLIVLSFPVTEGIIENNSYYYIHVG